ncbi:MAG: HPr family phosphocarrier protein [Lachnospiraceae bacterium]|jgi:phosphocarrier protein|nr:HPr family phosphocarrier protein [Lachnospiraceae bacterium]
MKTIEYVITDPVGVHARPAGLLVKKAASYKSNIMLKNMETGKSADAKRIMSVMSLGVKQGNKIELSIEGEDEDAASSGLEDFLKENL